MILCTITEMHFCTHASDVDYCTINVCGEHLFNTILWTVQVASWISQFSHLFVYCMLAYMFCNPTSQATSLHSGRLHFCFVLFLLLNRIISAKQSRYLCYSIERERGINSHFNWPCLMLGGLAWELAYSRHKNATKCLHKKSFAHFCLHFILQL